MPTGENNQEESLKPFFETHPGFYQNAQIAAYQQAYPHLYGHLSNGHHTGQPHLNPGYQNPYVQPWFNHAAHFSNQLTNVNWNHYYHQQQQIQAHHQQQQIQAQQQQQIQTHQEQLPSGKL